MSFFDRAHLSPILERSADGDPQALNSLLGQMRPYLKSQLQTVMGRENAVPVDDSGIVQTSLIRIYQHIGELRERSVLPFLAWSLQILRHVCIDAIRSERRRKMSAVGSQIEELVDCRAVAPPEPEVDRREELLAALEEFDRVADAEIGRRLGESVGNVRVLRSRALQKLRRLMPDEACSSAAGSSAG
jgi:DNA-directed RNA polymerase specialized sigma24 family protein